MIGLASMTTNNLPCCSIFTENKIIIIKTNKQKQKNKNKNKSKPNKKKKKTPIQLKCQK